MPITINFPSSVWIVLLVTWLVGVIWAYFDGRDRGKPGWLVAAMVMLTPWPAGLLVWLVFRPAPTVDATPKAFDLNDFKVQ